VTVLAIAQPEVELGPVKTTGFHGRTTNCLSNNAAERGIAQLNFLTWARW
jgi:hypothetical protein